IINLCLGTSLAVLIMLSAGVIFVKFSFTNFINLCFMIIFVFLFVEKVKLDKGIINICHANWRYIFPAFLLFIFNFSLLFFARGDYDYFTFEFFWYIILLFVFLLNFNILNKAVSIFSNIFLLISILAIVNLFISFIGIELPNIKFNISNRDTTYFLYPGTVRLHGQDYSFFGLNGFRLAGWFTEPSIFGILSCFVLYTGIFDKRKWKKTTILIGLLFSMSVGAFVMIASYFIFGIKSVKSRVVILFGLLIFILTVINIVPSEILNRFFLDKLSGDIINERIGGNFDLYYNNYLYFGSFKEHLIGRGVNILSVNDFVASDYRGFIVKYGLLGVFCLLLLVTSYLPSKFASLNTKI